MDSEVEFYICAKCFEISDSDQDHHLLTRLHFPGYPPGHELLKPPYDSRGNLATRAPRWYVEGYASLVRPR